MEIKFLTYLTIVIAPFVLLGVALFSLTRWSRKKSLELKKEVTHHQIEGRDASLASGDLSKAVKYHFFGTLPKQQQIIGRILAIACIAVFSAFLLFATYLIIKIGI